VSIARNIEEVYEQIGNYCHKAGIDPSGVELVAVSKTVGGDKVQEAYDAGMRMFGENRVQEFVAKSAALPGDIKWNLIGQLQTNKVKYIINQGVYLLHSLDRMALAEALEKQCEKCGTHIDALIQVNLTKENTKSGLYEEELDGFLEDISHMERLRIKGIMTIGPTFGGESETRGVFARAKRLFDRLKNDIPGAEYLSMGMTGDFGWAILEGSNMVRVGTAIFGERKTKT